MSGVIRERGHPHGAPRLKHGEDEAWRGVQGVSEHPPWGSGGTCEHLMKVAEMRVFLP